MTWGHAVVHEAMLQCTEPMRCMELMRCTELMQCTGPTQYMGLMLYMGLMRCMGPMRCPGPMPGAEPLHRAAQPAQCSPGAADAACTAARSLPAAREDLCCVAEFGVILLPLILPSFLFPPRSPCLAGTQQGRIRTLLQVPQDFQWQGTLGKQLKPPTPQPWGLIRSPLAPHIPVSLPSCCSSHGG